MLFDLEVSGSSCKSAFNSSIGVQSEEIDLSDILSGDVPHLDLALISTSLKCHPRRLHKAAQSLGPEGVFCAAGNGKVSSCAAAEGSFTALTGLLEVEPLHFTCISTSDGTRVERDDASIFTGNRRLRSPKVCSAPELLFMLIVLLVPVSTFGVTPAVNSVPAGPFSEASTALSSAAQVALQSLSHAMVSAEQQLQVLQEKQQQLLKLQQQVSVCLSRLFIHRRSPHERCSSGPFGPLHCCWD